MSASIDIFDLIIVHSLFPIIFINYNWSEIQVTILSGMYYNYNEMLVEYNLHFLVCVLF